MTLPKSHPPNTALVLSGGGARGAYEAGVLAGVFDLLGSTLAAHRAVFDVFTGTSVGAITAAHLAACADRGDHGIPDLLRHWTSLRLDTHLRLRLGRFLGGFPQGLLRKMTRSSAHGPRWGRALLDSRPLERMVESDPAWGQLHENIRRGVVKALIVSALNVADGRTVSFVELAPGQIYVPSRDSRRSSRVEPITPTHVLASAALPLLFPSRRLGTSYFCDGGLRFNTPISPAIRTGANKLMIVALRARQPASEMSVAIEQYPNPVFLLGKILDALLLDPIDYDLAILERFNRMLHALADAAPREAVEHVERVLQADRGVPYRRLETLVFRPSQDIGALALEHMRRHKPRCRDGAATAFLESLAALGAHVEADLLSYLLFDGEFAHTLIELGRADARSRREEVLAFFGLPHIAQ
jgi:NTE family protein